LKKFYVILLRIAFITGDILLLNLCLFVCSYFANKYYVRFDTTSFGKYFVVASLIWLFVTRLFSLYNDYTLINHKCLLRATRRSIFVFVLVFSLYVVFLHNSGYSYLFLLTYYLFVITAFALARTIFNFVETIFLRHIDKSKPVTVLAIASLGGHWIQLLRLMPLFKVNNVIYISTNANLKNAVGGSRYYAVPDANRNDRFKLLQSLLSITWVILFSRPEIIITTGAAPGLFAVFIGRVLGIKTVWLDSMANVGELSLSGNIALKFADRVYTQWEHLSTTKIIFAGNILEG
jgi:oligosaccharide biosynthesis protein Alg14